MDKNKRRKSGILLCILLSLSLAVGGALAYMFWQTGQLNNQFAPATVSCQVNSDGATFDVKNTGIVNAYIRAAIVVNWIDYDDPNGAVRGIAPVEGTDYKVEKNLEDWWQDSTTGYYYYRKSVAPNEVTTLITGYGLEDGVSAPEGYELCVEVVAEAIQADGTTDAGDVPAYKDAWEINSISGN